MCDDFWGDAQWDEFMASMQRVLPNRPIVDLEDSEQIFHAVYDLDQRYQVPGARYLYRRHRKVRRLPALLAWRLRR